MVAGWTTADSEAVRLSWNEGALCASVAWWSPEELDRRATSGLADAEHVQWTCRTRTDVVQLVDTQGSPESLPAPLEPLLLSSVQHTGSGAPLLTVLLRVGMAADVQSCMDSGATYLSDDQPDHFVMGVLLLGSSDGSDLAGDGTLRHRLVVMERFDGPPCAPAVRCGGADGVELRPNGGETASFCKPVAEALLDGPRIVFHTPCVPAASGAAPNARSPSHPHPTHPTHPHEAHEAQTADDGSDARGQARLRAARLDLEHEQECLEQECARASQRLYIAQYEDDADEINAAENDDARQERCQRQAPCWVIREVISDQTLSDEAVGRAVAATSSVSPPSCWLYPPFVVLGAHGAFNGAFNGCAVPRLVLRTRAPLAQVAQAEMFEGQEVRANVDAGTSRAAATGEARSRSRSRSRSWCWATVPIVGHVGQKEDASANRSVSTGRRASVCTARGLENDSDGAKQENGTTDRRLGLTLRMTVEAAEASGCRGRGRGRGRGRFFACLILMISVGIIWHHIGIIWHHLVSHGIRSECTALSLRRLLSCG